MSMSQLMVVQPLLDAGKNTASKAGGKNRENDAGNPFQALLKGQIAAREPEKQALPQAADGREPARQPSASNETRGAADEAGSKEAVTKEEGRAPENADGTEERMTAEEEAAMLAQIVAAAAGAQVVPVEPSPGNDTAESADDALLFAAGEAGGGKKMHTPQGIEAEAEAGKSGMEDAGDEAGYGKVQADADESMSAPAQKPALDAAAPKVAETAAAVKPAAEQPAAQAQQPVPTVSTQPVQQAQVAPMAAAEANPAAARVMQQMGTPEWNQAIGQRILWMVGQAQQSASLTLNPPELGPVRIVVNVSNNNASANFFSANPDVRQALEGSLPRLREMMEGAGIQLGQAQVGAENSGNPQQGQDFTAGGKTAGVTGSEVDGSLTAVTEAPAARQKVTKGIVDTFA